MPAPRSLPVAPDLDQLKRQAKDLLRDARAGDPTALTRFHILPSFARASDEDLASASLALHDAQSVIAREHGFASWNALRERVEELVLTLDDAARELVEAATDGRTARAERLLALRPGIAAANFHTALVLGDAAAVEAHLARRPALAREPGGARGWEPLHYICYDSLGRSAVANADGLAAIARRLIALGADPNARFPWLHHGVRRPVLWGATRVTRVPGLAEVLLQSGADPDDGVTLPMAAAAGDIATLELLRAHGADLNQFWATDGSTALYAALQWATTPEGVQWLLAHGADADPVFAANGETPLHVAARRWGVAIAEALVKHGADVSRRRADGRTPYAVATLNANAAVADWLRAHGASEEIPLVDRLVAACSRGDRLVVETMLAAHPRLSDDITDAHYATLHRAAEQGDVAAIALLLDAGFDPSRRDDEIGKTALHSAAMAGQPDAVCLLLARGASLDIRDREFNGHPLVWAAEGSRSHRDRAGDYAEVGRLLLDAGSSTEWPQPTSEPTEEIVEILAEWQRARASRAGTAAPTTSRR